MASTTDSPYKNKVLLKINYFGGATTLSITTLSIMALSITTLSITTLSIITSINVSQ
jgi:hypothetical protein